MNTPSTLLCLSGAILTKPCSHGSGESARDEDGDGFYKVHINTIEGFGRSYTPGCAPGLTHTFLHNLRAGAEV